MSRAEGPRGHRPPRDARSESTTGQSLPGASGWPRWAVESLWVNGPCAGRCETGRSGEEGMAPSRLRHDPPSSCPARRRRSAHASGVEKSGPALPQQPWGGASTAHAPVAGTRGAPHMAPASRGASARSSGRSAGPHQGASSLIPHRRPWSTGPTSCGPRSEQSPRGPAGRNFRSPPGLFVGSGPIPGVRSPG